MNGIDEKGIFTETQVKEQIMTINGLDSVGLVQTLLEDVLREDATVAMKRLENSREKVLEVRVTLSGKVNIAGVGEVSGTTGLWYINSPA